MSRGHYGDYMSDLEFEIHVEELEADYDPSSTEAHRDGRVLRQALAALERRGIDREEQKRKAARIAEALRSVPDRDLWFMSVLHDGAQSTLAWRELRRREGE